MLRTDPSVFAVGKNYEIIVTSKYQSFISVKVGGRVFADHSNGIVRSASRTHNIAVPQELLNEHKKYTIIEKPVIKRLAYYTKTRKDIYYDYDFQPVPDENPSCYIIADAHNDTVLPVKAARYYGAFDFLVLNGDVPEDSSRTDNFNTIFDICAQLTHGTKPVVFARGNHDLRGRQAEKFSQYAPCENGHTYYTFRLGKIWGICLDCGEDKDDLCSEYGFTVACHDFRLEETEYLEKVIENASSEYDTPGVEIKLVVVHVPFTHRFQAPFDIEEEIFRKWSALLRENVKPHLMISGHTHTDGIYEPGCEYDDYGMPCKLLITPQVKKRVYYRGAGVRFGRDSALVTLTDCEGKKQEKTVVYADKK